MKKLTFSLLLFLCISALLAQDASVTLNEKNPTKIWPSVEMALAERGIAPTAFNQSSGTLLSNYTQFNVMLIPNRAKYKFTLVDNKLNIDLENKEYQSQTGWVSNPIPLGKKTTEKQVGELSKRIAEITQSAELMNKAVLNSKLFPVFKNNVTINNLTMNIVSTRTIGDKTMISGFFNSSTAQKLQSMNDLTLISPSGTSYETDKGSFAGNETHYMGQAMQMMEPDIPVSYDVLFDTKAEKMDVIKKFSVKMYNPDNTQFNFYDIPLPIQVNPNLDASTIEIYKDVYLTFRKHEKTDNNLTIHFVVENKTRSPRQVKIQEAHIIDSNGAKNDEAKVFLGGEDIGFRRVEVEPEVPVAGYFVFEGNVPFEEIRLLRFSTFQYAHFAIRKIVCKE